MNKGKKKKKKGLTDHR